MRRHETILAAMLLVTTLSCGPAGDEPIVIDTGSDEESPDDGDTTNGDDTTEGDDDNGTDPTECADCDGGEYEAELQFCVEYINELRASVDQPALTRSSALEDCAGTAAVEDAKSGAAHGHFQQTRGCGGTAFAENEVPGWPLSRYDSLRTLVQAGADMMFAEGPGGGHYENIVGDYTEVGCGIHITDSDAVWVVHNFR
jgi:hypothetical protein